MSAVTLNGRDHTVAPQEDSTLLSVQGLSVRYGAHEVVHDVGFSLERGESVALIGESGSGKSTIAKAILRLLPAAEATVDGTIRLNGREVRALPEK